MGSWKAYEGEESPGGLKEQMLRDGKLPAGGQAGGQMRCGWEFPLGQPRRG